MPKKNPLARFLSEPLVQFLIIGAGIYAAYATLGTPEEESADTKIHIDEAQISAYITEWQSRWNRPPTRGEIEGLIQNQVKEEVLYRQAVSMGLGKDDVITRRRMAQKLEFLTSDLAQAQQPAEGELEAYFAENLADYREPDLISFSQVFFNPDERGNATVDDAKAALEKFKTAGAPDPKTLEAGDRFMLQSYFPNATEAAVSRLMGAKFAETTMKLKVGEWNGPELSGYGVHLVYVYDLKEGAVPELAEVKDKVLEAWHEEQRESFNAEFLKNLKERFEIVIDEIPTESLLKAAVTEEKSSGEVKPAS